MIWSKTRLPLARLSARALRSITNISCGRRSAPRGEHAAAASPLVRYARRFRRHSLVYVHITLWMECLAFSPPPRLRDLC